VLVGALWLLTHQTIGWTTGQALERAVDVDLAGLVDIHASGGQQELVRRIGDRLALVSSEGEAAHYMLATNGGERLAGDVAAWPALNARLSQAGRITLPDGTDVQARATQLGPDLRLLVAREFGDTSALLRRVALVFLGGGSALVLAVGLLGRMAGARLSRRIGRINQAFREPTAQPLEPLSAGEPGDEIDELARHSTAALARQKRLVEAYREASDQVAHEIRTPLMHLDNKLVKLLKALPNGDPGPRLVEAREDIRHMVHMLESLLDIAASKARRGDRTGLRPVDFSSLVRRIGELYSASAEESGHAFACEVAPGVFIEGEETQLTRLITNLLDNALKYVPAGGSVELELSPGPLLTVRDDGPGIPPDERDSVFGRFSRGSTHAGDAQGRGLGLTLARAIAERHGLAIRLVDTPKGACFVVSGEAA
jgi:signal transduction histidine kinase